MARRASVTKPLSVIMSVIMAPTRSSRKVRAERFGTAWARRVSQAQRGIGIGVSMGRHRRRSKTLQLRALPTRCARFAGSAVTLKGQQATKNLTPEGADQATETLNSREINLMTEIGARGLPNTISSGESGIIACTTDGPRRGVTERDLKSNPN